MLVTDDREVASRVARQSWHGLGSQPWLRHHLSAPEYELGSIGFNYRFDDPRAALVHNMLDRLDEENLRRKAIDEAYREAFSKQELLAPTLGPRPGDQSSYCLFTAVVDPSVARDEFRKALADRGIQTTVHYPLLHEDGVHAQANTRLPVSEEYARHCVTLPLYPQMEDWQRELGDRGGQRHPQRQQGVAGRCRRVASRTPTRRTPAAGASSASGLPTTLATSRSAPSCSPRSSIWRRGHWPVRPRSSTSAAAAAGYWKRSPRAGSKAARLHGVDLLEPRVEVARRRRRGGRDPPRRRGRAPLRRRPLRARLDAHGTFLDAPANDARGARRGATRARPRWPGPRLRAALREPFQPGDGEGLDGGSRARARAGDEGRPPHRDAAPRPPAGPVGAAPLPAALPGPADPQAHST